jgi:hypothetical protein
MESNHLNYLNNNSMINTNFFDRVDEDYLEEKNSNNISLTNRLIILCEKVDESEDKQNLKINHLENNLNLSGQFQINKKKTNIEDLSYYSIEQNFNDNNMNIEEEILNNSIKIGNDEQIIDPIFEMSSFEQGYNNSFYSFLHENFPNANEMDNTMMDSQNIINLTAPNSEAIKMDLIDDDEIIKMKKNLMSLKLSNKSVLSNSKITNESSINKSTTLNETKKLFTVSNLDNNNNLLNMSSCLYTTKSKRGRKKLLLDGIKTELIDKSFIREFKKYLKTKKISFVNVFEEDPIFWYEFFQNSNPPFSYTINNNEKIEFKSFNKNLLRFYFSKPSVRKLYIQFIKDKEKDLIPTIISKKVKKFDYKGDKKMFLFYKFYGKNLYKFYSDEYNLNEINLDNNELNISSSDILYVSQE